MRPFGAACEADVQCASRVCIQGPSLLRRCGVLCARDQDCAGMGGGGYNCAVDRAASGPRLACAASERGGGVGADPCMGDGDCDAALCLEGTCRNGCVGPADCAAGWRCGALGIPGGSVRVCRAEPITAVTVEDYTLFEGDSAVDRGINPQPVVVPRDAVSVTWSAQDLVGRELFASVASVRNPAGMTLLDLRTANYITDQPVREYFLERQVNSVTIPANDRIGPTPGVYTAGFGLFNDRSMMTAVASRRLRATVRIKRAPSAASLTLHLRVFFVGLPTGPTAATGAASARLQNALAAMRSFYLPLNIGVTVDEYADLPAADAARFSVIDSRAELEDLFTRSASSRGDVLNLFFVRGIAMTATMDGAIGIAGDIGGPAGLHGTIHSGVVAGWESSLGAGRDLLPQVIAHECAHYLGLWHTRERLAACTAPGQTMCAPFGAVDALGDTPADNAGSARNLMHWQTDGTNSRLSIGQGAVLRAHAIVR